MIQVTVRPLSEEPALARLKRLAFSASIESEERRGHRAIAARNPRTVVEAQSRIGSQLLRIIAMEAGPLAAAVLAATVAHVAHALTSGL
jgi:hypothetical protein